MSHLLLYAGRNYGRSVCNGLQEWQSLWKKNQPLMGFAQSLLQNTTGQRTIHFIHTAFFTLCFKHRPMTAAGTPTSEKCFKLNSVFLKIPIHKCETFVATGSAQNQHHLLGTPPQHPAHPSMASISSLAPCYHTLRDDRDDFSFFGSCSHVHTGTFGTVF